MIIVKLWGGLGNQLFQYAMAYKMAKKMNSKLILDISWFNKQDLREPEILDMEIKYDDVVMYSNKNLLVKLMNSKIINILIRIPSFSIYKLPNMYYLKESRYKYIKKIDNLMLDNIYIDGYWQCSYYFDDLNNDYKNMFKFNNIRPEVKKYADYLREHHSVAIHVRRGDYSKNKLFYSRLKQIGDKYYKNAIEYMEKKNSDCTFYLFSNNLNDSKKMILGVSNININIINDLMELNAQEEWYLMSNCRHQIIGNSTFSWWAAYLNNYEEKIVIAPNEYMGNDDIIPEEWIKIEVG